MKIVIYAIGLAVSFAITYGLALMGEPQSIWLMSLIGLNL